MAGTIISGHRSRSESEQEERRRKKAKKTKKKQQTLILLDGSDEDREANEDLTDAILEKAKKRMRGIEEPERDVRIGDLPNSSSIIEVSSSDGVEVIDEVVVADINVNLKRGRAKERKKNKKTKRGEEDKVGAADGKLGEEDEVGVADGKSIIDQNVGISKSPEAMGEEVEITNNTVLRKLLRGPRYFDPPGESWGACYNCGEVGHAASKCLVKKPKKPCYICGKFGHAAKSCSEVHACFICKRTGHRAKNCSAKQNIETLRFCLHCGSLGHDMSTCTNDYDQDDLKEIQCYICRQYGHLCCADFVDTGPSVVSCYSCGQIGHAGSGCARDKNGKGSTLCYKCGEEGHLARGCNNLYQSDKKLAEPSTPLYAPAENDEFLGFKSVPHDSSRSQESWGLRVPHDSSRSQESRGLRVPHDSSMSQESWGLRHHEGSGFSSGKFRRNNGWITNGGYSPSRNANLNGWGSPKTPFEKGQWNSGLQWHGSQSNGGYSHSRNANLNGWGSPKTPFEKGQWNSGLRWHGSQSSYIPSSRSSNFRYNDPRSSYTPCFGGQRFQSDASSSWRPHQHAKFAHPT